MKTVSTDFTDSRKLAQPYPTLKKAYLDEYRLNGSLIKAYDLSDRIIHFPPTRGSMEKDKNEFIADAISMDFWDDDDYIHDLLEKTSRIWGLRLEIGLDYPFKYNGLTQIDEVNVYANDGLISVRFGADGYIYTGSNRNASGAYRYAIENDLLVLKGHSTGDAETLYAPDEGNYFYSGFYFASRKKSDCSKVDISGGVASDIAYDGNRYFWLGNSASDTISMVDSQDPTNLIFHQFVVSDNMNFIGIDYYNGYIFATESFFGTFRIYDASDPETYPYSLIGSLDLFGLGVDKNQMICTVDSKRMRAYVGTYTGIAVIDITDITNPTLIENYTIKDYQGIYITDDKRYLIGIARTNQKIGIFNIEYGLNLLGEIDIDWDYPSPFRATAHWIAVDPEGRYVAAVDPNTSDLHLYKFNNGGDPGDMLTMFDGEVQLSQVTDIGRNIISVSAFTWQKTLERQNAEMIYNSDRSAITIPGIRLTDIDGGLAGVKHLHYRYQSGDPDEFFLTYEDGEEVSFTEDGNYTLTSSSGQQTATFNVDVSKLPTNVTEKDDYFVISDIADINTAGKWYAGKTFEFLIGKLFDQAIIPITTQLININDIEVGGLDPYFIYIQNFYQENGDKKSCVEPTIPKSEDFFMSAGHKVYSVSFDDAGISFTKTYKLDITTYCANADFVAKIFRYTGSSPDRIALITASEEKDQYSERIRYKCEGVILFDADNPAGTAISKSITDLIGAVPGQVFAMSFQGKQHAYNNADRYLYYLTHYQTLITPENYWKVKTIDLTNGNISGSIQLYHRADANSNLDYEQLNDCPLLIYDSPSGNLYSYFFLYEYNKAYPPAGNKAKIYLVEKIEGGAENQIELTDVTDDYDKAEEMNGYFSCRVGLVNEKGYLISTPFDGNNQYQFACKVGTTPSYVSPSNDIVSYLSQTRYPDISYNKVVAWQEDSSGKQYRIIRLIWKGESVLPEITSEVASYEGDNYPCAHQPSSWEKGDVVMFLGLAEMGGGYDRIHWIGITNSMFYVPEADLEGLDTRKALNEFAISSIATWNRYKSDTAIFYSRGNYQDTIIVDNDIYTAQFEKGRQLPYEGVVVENTYKDYGILYRYPENINEGMANILRIDSRFATKVNAPSIAKAYYDWFGYLRYIITVKIFMLLEANYLDLIQFKIRDVNNILKKQLDCIVTDLSYNPDDNHVTVKMIKQSGIELQPKVWVANKWQ